MTRKPHVAPTFRWESKKYTGGRSFHNSGDAKVTQGTGPPRVFVQDTDLTLYQGDALEVLRTLEPESVHCVVTSPPYWGLRDYSTEGQLGLEATPELYLEHMVAVFREIRRVMRTDATAWVNMGDSFMEKQQQMIPARLALALQADGWYLRSQIVWAKPNPMPESVTDRPTTSHEFVYLLTKSPRYFFDQEAVREANTPGGQHRIESSPGTGSGMSFGTNGQRYARLASVGTEANGRNLRSVWEIPTQPYPEAHFATYPEELVRRCVLAGSSERGCCPECGAPWTREVERQNESTYARIQREHGITYKDMKAEAEANGITPGNVGGTHAPGKRGATYVSAHNVTLSWEPSCRCGGMGPIPCTVLDPFFGSGTTGLVARKHGRRTIGIELNVSYCELAARRLQQLSLLAEPSPEPAPRLEPHKGLTGGAYNPPGQSPHSNARAVSSREGTES